MAIFDSVKNSLTCAVDTVSDITQNLIEKNRLNAQLNRLRAVMKSECEMINRAYITLGKKYYENKLSGSADACENEEELFLIIENSKEQIKKARIRYRQLLESKTVSAVEKYSADELEDITVACSNEDEYGESPFASEAESPAEEEAEAPADEEVAAQDSF